MRQLCYQCRSGNRFSGRNVYQAAMKPGSFGSEAEMASSTSVVRISRALDERLDALAAKTGRRKCYYASKAIERYLADIQVAR